MSHIEEYDEFVDIQDIGLLESFTTSIVRSMATGLVRLKRADKFENQALHRTSFYDENEERIYCRRGFEKKLISDFMGMKTVPEIFNSVLKNNRNKQVLGYREILKEEVINHDDTTPKVLLQLGPYNWITYQETYERIIKVAYFLTQLDIHKQEKVAIFADTSIDWMVMALACMFLRITVVTILPSLADEYVKHCIKTTQPTCLVFDQKSSKRLQYMLSEFTSLKIIIYSTMYIDKKCPPFENLKCQKTTFDDIFGHKIENIAFLDCLPPCQSEDIALIMFTSGSTGTPKGVMISQSNIVSAIAGGDYGDFLRDQIYPGYLPLSHIFEFSMELFAIFSCCRIGYSSPGTLIQSSPMLSPSSVSDLSLLQPTRMVVVPLVLERIMTNFQLKLQKLPRMKRLIFQTLYNVKASHITKGYSTKYLDRFFSQKFLQIFGGKLEYIVSGGSVLSKKTQEFINVVFCHVIQGYASTEVASGGTLCPVNYPKIGSTGFPSCCSELKIIPWPEGGFHESGVNIRQGELLISGNSTSCGYYGDEELTTLNFVRDPKTGKTWYHTSDIVRLLDDLSIKIICRKLEILKLSHGEYVHLIPIETTIASSDYVDFVCVTTNPNMEYLIGILCLNVNNVTKLAETLQLHEKEKIENLVEYPIIRDTIKEDIDFLIKKGDFFVNLRCSSQ
ncbi:Long-chain-fatty-acid--CoA ligase 3 [Thelohanellus kitauei]|uniref:long-chain-fatty-acid--CoA ligase n=1 Tax=Thelohanellus kitauei TaxID=669202 RepID=A0A0C2MEA3_THEKT|nr:Long-chain-fatty-acid--CoA ligase 3 [Thelohanellus kitauei]